MLLGGSGADILSGGSGRDTLKGDAGDDVLIGGVGGGDRLYGGAGADRFVFTSVGDSFGSGANRDEIFDFSRAEGDKIDLRGIDAVQGGVDDAFTLVGRFTNHPGELTVTAQRGGYLVQADVNGDHVADFILLVHAAKPLVAADFLL
jgi:Ca2+-binding RTX toxin-like protein